MQNGLRANGRVAKHKLERLKSCEQMLMWPQKQLIHLTLPRAMTYNRLGYSQCSHSSLTKNSCHTSSGSRELANIPPGKTVHLKIG